MIFRGTPFYVIHRVLDGVGLRILSSPHTVYHNLGSKESKFNINFYGAFILMGLIILRLTETFNGVITVTPGYELFLQDLNIQNKILLNLAYLLLTPIWISNQRTLKICEKTCHCVYLID